MAIKSKQGIPAQKVITIKHGSAPEIQAVNISVKKRRSNVSRESDEVLYASDLEQPFYRRRPTSKTMTTTKSTMTNDDEYQIEVTKSPDDGNATPVTSGADDDREEQIEDTTDEIHIAAVKDAQHHKALAWKMTPKVHFPVREDSPLMSPVPLASLPQYQGSFIAPSQTVDWNYLPEPVIDPPFEHRPDKSYVIHQNQPIPLNPLKVWPGYGGNLYFEPVRVETKPLNIREDNGRIARTRSRTTSRFTFADQTTTPDALSDSRYMSLPPSSPYHSDNRRNYHYSPDTDMHPLQELHGSQPGDLLFQRQMAHLDKNYVLNMKGNSKLHEDWSWIAGMESIGTLCIGDTGNRVKKHPSKPYSRTLVVEKVPRKFVFHPGNTPAGINASKPIRPIPLVQVKIDTKKRNKYPPNDYAYWRDQNIANWSGHKKQKSPSKSQNNDKYREVKRRMQLPSIPIRVKGHKVSETNCYNPWEMFKVGSRKPVHSGGTSRDNSPVKQKSRVKDILSAQAKSRFTSPENKENFSLSITNYLGTTSPDKIENNERQQRLIPKLNSYLQETAEHETDDEDKLNYETIKSVFYNTREDRTTRDGRRVPNSTPC